MEIFKLLLLLTLIKLAGSTHEWLTYTLSSVVLISVICHQCYATNNGSLAMETPAAASFKRTTELPVIGTTKPHQSDESKREIEVAPGDFTRASQFDTLIWPSVPVQISASYKRQIEHDTRASISSTGVVEQQLHAAMSQGLAYIGANHESLLKTVPHLNISTPLYQTSRSMQPSVLVPSLERPIKPTLPSSGSSYAQYASTHSIATPAIHNDESFELFSLAILTSSLEVSPTASLRRFQTVQNWRTAQALQSHLFLMPADDLSTLIWNKGTELNTVHNIMALSNVQPSPSNNPGGGLMQTTDSTRSLSQLSKDAASTDLSASDFLNAATMPTHAQLSTQTITPSLKSLPEWLKKLSTPDLLEESQEYYHTQTAVSNMALATEPGHLNDSDDDEDDPSLRPAMTPSPSIIMESSTSFKNWSHRNPISQINSTVNKEGKESLFFSSLSFFIFRSHSIIIFVLTTGSV